MAEHRQPRLAVGHVHEALLREWPRLVEWIDQDRDVIRLRRALHTAAHEWQTAGRDEAMLFRGSRLVAAEDAARNTPLTPTERDFLQASHDLDQHERTEAEQRAVQQARQNRRLRRLLTAAAVLLVIALAAGLLAFNQRNRANDQADAARAAQSEAEQAGEVAATQREAAQQASDEATAQRTAAESARNEALARGLAAQSTRLLSTNDNDLALLLAIESRRFADQAPPDSTATGEAQASLLQAVSDDPHRVRTIEAPTGTSVISGMTYSPDGRTLAGLSSDGKVLLWDADSGQPEPVQPDDSGMTAVQGTRSGLPIAMNDTLLAYYTTNSADSDMMLWDLDAQAPWKWQVPLPDPEPTVSGNTVLALDLSQNGLLARSISGYPNLQTSTVDIWDTNTGSRVGPIIVDGLVDSLGISDDGTKLALNVISPDQITLDVEMLDVRTGTSLWRAVAHPGSTTDTFDDIQQNFSSWVKFSDDGTLVSSIVSRSTVGAIATLDSTSGALAPSNGVGRDRTVMEVSDDLRYVILAAGVADPGGPWGTVAPTEVVEAATGDVLASFETDFAPLGSGRCRSVRTRRSSRSSATPVASSSGTGPAWASNRTPR